MDSPQKPLPDIPARRTGHNQGQLTRLTIEGRAHLRQFIKNALLEEKVEGHEEWALSIELALQELGHSMSREGWLAGLRRTRKILNDRRNTEERERRRREQERLSAETEAKDSKGRFKAREYKGTKPEKEKETDSVKDLEKTRNSNASSVPKARTSEDRVKVAIEQLTRVASSPILAIPKPTPKHMLLVLSPEGALLPPHDMDFDLVPSGKICVFSPGIYSLPSTDSSDIIQTANATVLYGLDEWDVDMHESLEDATRLVGGTFTFKGINSSSQFKSLSKVLRLSIYVYLSLLLEQHLLSNSHVELHFPAATSQPLVFSYSSPNSSPSKQPNVKKAKPPSSGLWSFFTKKTENLFHRATSSHSSSTEYRRTGSLDISSVLATHSDRSSEDNPSTRPLRRISFTSGVLPPRKGSIEVNVNPTISNKDLPFSSSLARISASLSMLSTSVGVTFPLPPLLVALEEKERQDPQRKLLGDEKAGLNSMLGWEGRESRGQGMAGLIGFARHQAITVLYTEYIRVRDGDTTPTNRNSKYNTDDTLPLGPSLSSDQDTKLIPCDRGRWITYRYYSRSKQDGNGTNYGDSNLGDVIERLCHVSSDRNEDACGRAGCATRHCEHARVWVHESVRVVAAASDCTDVDAKEGSDKIWMWESCAVCQKSNDRKEMSDGAYLISFAKFIELLIYSSILCTPTPHLCEHTRPPPMPSPVSNLHPSTRFNIARHFIHGSRSVKFSVSAAPDIYELRLPRLQILRGRGADSELSRKRKASTPKEHSQNQLSQGEEEKRILRREIKLWWQGIADHMDKLEECLSPGRDESFHKSLPRLPSTIDPYEDETGDINSAAPSLNLPPLPPSIPSSPPDGTPPEVNATSAPHPPVNPVSSPKHSLNGDLSPDSVTLLSNLRYTFQTNEQFLYAQLSRTPSSNLNDVRRLFSSVAHGASKRLNAWKKKHSNGNLDITRVGDLKSEEPEWWKPGCHAIPGSNVVVREGEWGSIIAFTLSSLDYQRELANMSSAKLGGSTITTNSAFSTSAKKNPAMTTNGYVSLSSGPFKQFMTATPVPDPDVDSPVWHEAEECSAVITRHEHPRDQSGLLSLRDVLRHRRSSEGSGSSYANPSRFAGFGASTSRFVIGTPPSAWAKPAVEVSMQAADGRVSGLPEVCESAEKILHDIDPSVDSTRGVSSLSSSFSSASGFLETNIRRGKTDSIISKDSDSTVDPDSSSTGTITPPIPPLKDPGNSSSDTSTGHSSTDANSPIPSGNAKNLENQSLEHTVPVSSKELNEFPSKLDIVSPQPSSSHQHSASTASIATSLTSSLTHAMRYILSQGEIARSTSPAHHHKLLALDAVPIDDRPHIKYDWTIGKRLKFNCTVYYAKQFDMLRKKCGVEDVMIKSLERSENWIAEGGKSRSNFWKTSDNRFIIKTLVNAWNVADLQVLLDIAPSYFRYIESTSGRPTVLAKVLGFFTVEIKNIETGTTQAKSDLLVMENLFYDRKVTKTFDLKGIQGRKVKPNGLSNGNTTLFDGDWIEGQRKTLTLVHTHSKLVLQEAIKADAEFLSKSNIMDYSLLIGVDQDRRQIACGLVDIIGSYTFAKTLEYKAKQGLHSGKEVTVIPPNEYHDRFITAINNYFMACPDKWSRTNESWSRDDLTLPSVL